MKILLSVLLFMTVRLCAFSQTPLVYVNLVSHNEDTYQQYINNASAYYATRSKMITLAQLCQNRGAVWHLGTDWPLPIGIMRHDTGSVLQLSNNKNILRHLSEDLDVSIDAHSHESTYNYTDVAHLLDSIGVGISSIMSGFLLNQDQNGHYWTDYQNLVPGDSFPHVTWQPDILWGAGTPGHTNDPTSMGIWRPTDSSSNGFVTHAPANHLINFGQGCKMKYTNNTDIHELLEPLRDLLNAIRLGNADPNKIYCTSIFFTEAQLPQPFFIGKSGELIDSINAYVTKGEVAWMGIDSVVNMWQNDFGNVGSISACADWTATGLTSGTMPGPVKIYPNPSHETVEIECSVPLMPSSKVEVIDLAGRRYGLEFEVLSPQTFRANIQFLPEGMYILSIDGIKFRQKLIRN